MLPRDHFVSRFLYFTTAGVKCCVASVKSCPVLHFSSGPSGPLMPALLSVENWVPLLKAVAREREGCGTYILSLMYRLNQTESAILM
jgi:hypothetical protein